MDVAENVLKICEFLNNKKALNILICDTSKFSSVADCFIFCTATSIVHAKALADFIEIEMSNQNFKIKTRDGFNQSDWVVLDFGDIIVHIFTKEKREYYNLEKLFNEGNNLKSFEKVLVDIQKQNKKQKSKEKQLQKKADKINKKNLKSSSKNKKTEIKNQNQKINKKRT